MQARLGQRVKVRRVEQGRVGRAREGVLSPGRDDVTEVAAEDDGRVVFRLAPYAHWFQLHPDVFVDAQEQPDGRLRVEMSGGSAFLIETHKGT